MTQENLKAMLELSQVYFYCPSLTPESKKLKNIDSGFLEEFAEGIDEEAMKFFEQENQLQSIFAFILRCVDSGNSTEKFQKAVSKLIEKMSSQAKSSQNF